MHYFCLYFKVLVFYNINSYCYQSVQVLHKGSIKKSVNIWTGVHLWGEAEPMTAQFTFLNVVFKKNLIRISGSLCKGLGGGVGLSIVKWIPVHFFLHFFNTSLMECLKIWEHFFYGLSLFKSDPPGGQSIFGDYDFFHVSPCYSRRLIIGLYKNVEQIFLVRLGPCIPRGW